MTQNTIGGAGAFLIGYGTKAIDLDKTTGLIIMGFGVLLIIVVGVLQKFGVNIQATPNS
jgi:hypothetical protein